VSPSKRDTARRAFATLGAAGPIAFLAVSVLAGLLKPGYDIREQSVSELAVGAYGWLQTANFFALGAAMLAAAIALNAGPRSRSAVVLLAAAGAGMLAVGCFPDDVAGAAPTSHGAAHDTISLAVFLALIAASALHGRALRRAGVQRRLARYSRLTAWTVFGLFAVFAVFAGDVGDPLYSVSGLLERLFIGVALAWIVVVSITAARAGSYSRGPTDVPLLDETIGESLRRTAERFPERQALVVRHQGYGATYAELWCQVDAAARGLMARGVDKGDRVGIWAPSRHEWVVTQLATARIGAILVTINPAYKAAELRYALEKAGVSLLVMARGFRGADYVAMLAEVRDGCPALRGTIVLDDDWQALLADGERIEDSALAAREATLHCDDAINVQFTSGTTGAPKGATLSHRNILNNAYLFTGHALRCSEHDRVCVPVPLYHTFGMVIGTLGCVTHGACMVLPGEAFGPAAVLEAVEAERCTALYGVPTMFIAELADPDFERYDLSSLRTGAMGGAPCPVELIHEIRSRMHLDDFAIACGMTETSPVATQTAPDDPLDKQVGTVGRAHPHVEVKIVDPETGATLPRGIPGEQCTRGYNVMRGYWNDPDATAAAIDAGGWMHTGDLAVMDAGGYVSIVGRIKDMIIRGGENISPREIEELLHGLPGVADAHVIGVPSPRYGEEVMAWVKPRDGATITPRELAAACRGRLASYKIPRHWRITDTFPMTITGKVQKYRLRELAGDAEGGRSG